MKNTATRWVNKTYEERSIFIAKLVDAMIYSDAATRVLEKTIDRFEKKGYIKSKFLPESINSQPIPDCKPCYKNLNGEIFSNNTED